jgi:hypothetical protein
MLKRILFIAALAAGFILVHIDALNEPPAGFTDVDARYAWASEAIGALTAGGIVNGMEEGVFAPHLPVTREQLAKMLCLAFKSETEAASAQSYLDVPADKWSFAFVEAAKEEIARLVAAARETDTQRQAQIAKLEAELRAARAKIATLESARASDASEHSRQQAILSETTESEWD